MSPAHTEAQSTDGARSIQKAPVSRRLFLKSSGAAIASAGIATPAAVAQDATPQATPAAMAQGEQGATSFQFFNNVEASVVEGLTARILPGTPDDPGAREAGVVYFIDRSLGGTTDGYSFKTYTQGPYLIVSEQQPQVETTSRTDIYQVESVMDTDLASRYGYQSVMAPQEIYRRGVESVLASAQATYQKDFGDLTDDELDELLEAMEADKADGFDAPSGKDFFSLLRNATIEGMFSDPMYGGNRDMVGWKLIRYPGARGHYSRDEVTDSNFSAEPTSLADMDMAAAHQHEEG